MLYTPLGPSPVLLQKPDLSVSCQVASNSAALPAVPAPHRSSAAPLHPNTPRKSPGGQRFTQRLQHLAPPSHGLFTETSRHCRVKHRECIASGFGQKKGQGSVVRNHLPRGARHRGFPFWCCLTRRSHGAVDRRYRCRDCARGGRRVAAASQHPTHFTGRLYKAVH